MTRARDIANLVDSNGDIVAGALDNVPPSNDASALTTGTLAAARLPSSGISASAVDTGTLPVDQVTAGSVLQCVSMLQTVHYSTTAGNSTDNVVFSGTITPKRAGSKFFLQAHFPVSISDDTGSSNSVNAYHSGYFQRSVAGGSYSTADGTGSPQFSGSSAHHVEMSAPRTGDNSTDYWSGNRYRMICHKTQFFDEPSYSAGQSITYRFRLYTRSNSSNARYVIGEVAGYSTDKGYLAQPWGLVVWEVAQ